jgi:shikimate kinase
VLIGFMGSGKSSIGRRLARRLRCKAIDLDHVVELRAGRSIPEIFAAEGEPAFRDLETAALAECLGESGVIATGGGVLKRAENRELLRAAAARGALVVYLRAAPAVLAHRIRRQPGKRPLIDGNAILNEEETQLRVEHLLAERAPLYESCSSLVVDTDNLSPEQTVRQIIAGFQSGVRDG